MLIFEILIFGFALWLGAYLISRNPADLRLLLTGAGLIAYAIGLALGILSSQAENQDLSLALSGWQKPLLLLPAICWLLLLVHLMRGDESWYSRLQNHRNPLIVVFTATIFFGLGLGLLIFPFGWLPHNLLVVGIGIDLLLLGAAVAFLDAFDEGESLLPHFTRSFGYAFFLALIFGGQIALVMIINKDITFSMLALLLSTIAAAILLQTFSGSIQNLLDGLVPQRSPQAYQDQTTFREAANTASRQNETLDLSNIDDPAFARLTRRALSHMANLPRLSASPLTRLPLIEKRLQDRGNPADTLQRASELRAVLSESIAHLKPEKQAGYGTTDPWRHYNALYYPYVVGLKPYSRRVQHTDIDEAPEQVLEWFRTQVPQRTLYNWQNEAARLVARDLQEQSWPSG
jgi:hypothetical protein